MVIREPRNPFVHPAGDVPWFGKPARIVELEAQIEALQTTLQEARDELARLRVLVDENHFSPSEDTISERPWLTMEQVSRREGVSLSTISRYLNSGYWQGEKVGHPYKWHIYADQVFRRKSRRAA